jgi:(E)-4-hydroxy-3-methylbut-2-enyl-diphosphate synthase
LCCTKIKEIMPSDFKPYCNNPFLRQRLSTLDVKVGKVGFGGTNPIRLQSMTTTDTMDTTKSVDQSARMIDAGCELVRLTAPSKKDAENLREIRNELLKKGYNVPIVADIHFTPNAAEIAAQIVEKVRVNPGNYADKKKFEEHIYTDESYQAELIRIEEKFTPLVKICKERGTAMRIGTNHGSLSDRILSRYGDTPLGMVESAMEFIRICEKNDFRELVISMKASNTLVMVQAYRLLTAQMLEIGHCYPLHLGVTEAGDGEDGRVKSAVGIGALLEDGLGDTIRVSLTEEPEYEIPVARKLALKHSLLTNNLTIKGNHTLPYSPFEYKRAATDKIHNIGANQVPVVVADLSDKQNLKPSHFYGFGYSYSIELDKWNLRDQAADYVFVGDNEISFEVPGTLGVIMNHDAWLKHGQNKQGFYPISAKALSINSPYFLSIEASDDIDFDEINENAILVVSTKYDNKTQVFRKFLSDITKNKKNNPLIIRYNHQEEDLETYQVYTSSDAGSILIDGYGDGIWLSGNHPLLQINSLAFGILQATRTRISKTEYISCPSCGRTLFDLQETTAKIRERTSHLKGIKIGIMGCIVNGPGEMADADYGYVGTGPGKITLYKEKEVIRKNVAEAEAVDALIDLIRDNGDWIDIKP